jgi:hypothetical protein
MLMVGHHVTPDSPCRPEPRLFSSQYEVQVPENDVLVGNSMLNTVILESTCSRAMFCSETTAGEIHGQILLVERNI